MKIDHLDYLLIKSELNAIVEKWYGTINSIQSFEQMSLENSKLSKQWSEDAFTFKDKTDKEIFSIELKINISDDVDLFIDVKLKRNGTIEIIITPEGEESDIPDSCTFLKKVMNIEISTGNILLKSKNKNKIYRCLLILLSIAHNDWTVKDEHFHRDVEFLQYEIKIAELRYQQKESDKKRKL